MDEQQKYIANRAIDENVVDTTARQIIRYVMACELWGQDTISPSNEYLAKKYEWSEETARVAIGKAKSSQFITTTGYGKKRCLELNVGFLKSKMAEAYQKSLRPKTNFSDVLPTTLPPSLPTGLPTTLPTTFGVENGTDKPQNQEKTGYSNRNMNKNTSESEIRVVSDSEEEKPARAKKDTRYKEVFAIFSRKPQGWFMHKTQIDAAKRLLEMYGLSQVERAMSFYKETEGEKFRYEILTPYDLEAKWSKLLKKAKS